MTESQTDVEVIVDPEETPTLEFRGIELGPAAVMGAVVSLVIALVGLGLGFFAKSWTVLYVGLGLFTAAVIAMLVIAEIERRRK